MIASLTYRLVARLPIRTATVSARSYIKPTSVSRAATPAKPAASASKKFAETTSDELHPLPSSVKAAAKPSSPSDAERFDAAGNSRSPADLSSRPSGPGPSGPEVGAARAAPGLTKGDNGSSSGSSVEGKEIGSDNSSNGDASVFLAEGFEGLSSTPFAKEVGEILTAPLDPMDVEIKPDGIIYLPEIKYRRILNKAFGPGGWGLAPRGETMVANRSVSREWALFCLGRFVAIARGEQDFFDQSGINTAQEGCKSNAMMRCCKDLGIANELWDPRWIRAFRSQHCVEVFAEHQSTKQKKKLWRRKDQPAFEYPYKEMPRK